MNRLNEEHPPALLIQKDDVRKTSRNIEHKPEFTESLLVRNDGAIIRIAKIKDLGVRRGLLPENWSRVL